MRALGITGLVIVCSCALVLVACSRSDDIGLIGPPSVPGNAVDEMYASSTPDVRDRHPSGERPAGAGEAAWLWRVVNSGAGGVAVRTACEQAARSSAPGHGIAEGTAARLLQAGNGDCAGWAYVVTEDGRESWIRLRYLSRAGAFLWPEAITSTTWATVLATARDKNRTCINAALKNEFAEALVLDRLVVIDFQFLEASAFRCLDDDTLVALATEATVIAPGLAAMHSAASTRECLRPFIAEIVARDRPQLHRTSRPTDLALELFAEARGVCVPKVTVAQAIRLIGLAVALNERATACVEATGLAGEAVGDVNVATAGRVGLENRNALLVVLMRCSPAASLLALTEQSLGRVLNEQEHACVSEQVKVEYVSVVTADTLVGTLSDISAASTACAALPSAGLQ